MTRFIKLELALLSAAFAVFPEGGNLGRIHR